MIHSLSGGSIKDLGNFTFVKVESHDSPSQFIWLKCTGFTVEVGSTVVYEDKNGWLKRGKVVRVDKGVSGQTPPAPLKGMANVLKVE
ncbi:MAG: hypothetical protein IJY84_04595 [Clostridia bacterium]|nr:hypothetical protein [Clostridia bacterium]